MLILFRFFCIALVSVCLTSCHNDVAVGANKFDDPSIVKIYEFKDRRLPDSLNQFLHDPNPVYRKEAILAFGSIQDSASVHKINRALLSEKDSSIKIAAAFVLGQTPSLETERVLLGAINREKNHDVLRELLESYGKTTHHWQLVQPGLLKDSSKAEGLAWSLYRAGLRGKTDSVANKIAARLLNDHYTESTRLAAAHFFNRGAKAFEKYLPELATSATQDESDEIRMASTAALRKIVNDSSLVTLLKILDQEQSLNVKVNAVRALQNFDLKKTKGVLLKLLKDEQPNLSVTAAEVIRGRIDENSVADIKNELPEIRNNRVKGILYEILLKYNPNEELVERITKEYSTSKDPFSRSFLLSSLHEALSSFDFLAAKLMEEKVSLVRTAAATALVDMHKHKAFTSRHKQKFLELLDGVIREKEPVLIGILVGPLADSTYGYKKLVADETILLRAKTVLSLPRDNESVQAVQTAMELFTGKKQDPIANEFNHPIDWRFVQKISKDQTAVVHTTKGRIRLQLFVEESPGSVENFVKLAQAGYFNDKYFHRVVPNFVIQGGCNRGDGWGSEDYSIRSEFGLRHYTTGSVGMASSGKDTEGTQWFITHSPTPHLDGRYTVFAQVIEGMDVVDRIEMGDRISKVELPGQSR
jgi:cyclophilin family peptidyl-prolyl cis-trans isomerase/HEAT repeat protein